jgi:hypothetical protein
MIGISNLRPAAASNSICVTMRDKIPAKTALNCLCAYFDRIARRACIYQGLNPKLPLGNNGDPNGIRTRNIQSGPTRRERMVIALRLRDGLLFLGNRCRKINQLLVGL